jgi:hypothetical protein
MQVYPEDPARSLVGALREQLEITTKQAGDDHFVVGRVFVGSHSFRVVRWFGLFEQCFRVAKWSVCRG